MTVVLGPSQVTRKDEEVGSNLHHVGLAKEVFQSNIAQHLYHENAQLCLVERFIMSCCLVVYIARLGLRRGGHVS